MADSTSSKGTILLTGANGSLGSTIVSQMVSEAELASYHGLYAVRNAEAAPALKSALEAGTPPKCHSHHVISLDLSNLASVRAVAATINARVASGEIPPIRALILNAAYLEFTTQSWNEDGFDMSFATNYLAHWLLTLLLLQSMDRQMGRILVVGSESHDPHNPKNNVTFNHERWKVFMDNGTEPIARGTWSSSKEDPTFGAGYRRYGASKFCQAMMIGELQRRLDTDPALSGICVLGVDPGSMPGNLTRRGPWFLHLLFFKLIMTWLAPLLAMLQTNGAWRTFKYGAADVISAALGSSPPVGESPKGMYLYGSRLEEMNPEAKDVKKMERLWLDSVGYAQLKEGETVLQHWRE